MTDKGKLSQQHQTLKQINENGNNRSNHQIQQQHHQQQQQIPANIIRERSFVRTSNQQNINKRRSLAFNVPATTNIQICGKPIMDVYRQPNVNFNVDHSSSSSIVYTTNSNPIQYVTAPNSMFSQQQQQQQQARLSLGSAPLMNLHIKQQQHHRPILLTHSHSVQMNHLGHAGSMVHHIPLVHSPSSGNVLHHANRVKFAPESKKSHKQHGQPINMNQMNNSLNQNVQMHQHGQSKALNAFQLRNNIQNNQNDGVATLTPYTINSLQRSKSLSSADALTRGIAGLGLGLGNDVTNIGPFPPEVKSLIDAALKDPNKLNSRNLMELSSHFIKRTVEGRRYALPISRVCLNIIAKEQKETFLEAILNTCRQWYQEREKLLFAVQGMKSPSRACLTSFMAFLTEMFCQLKRRQLQLQSPQCETASPPIVLLTLLSKCCEDCVKPPIKYLAEIECLFYVLTCIGQDMEAQLPKQLDILLSMIRDAFLNANDAPPNIRRTLLQLIELQASHWQLPGNTVLYYYSSVK